MPATPDLPACWPSWTNTIPATTASTEISTPTTPAMPITMTSDVDRRCGMLRKFIAVMAPICLKRLMDFYRPAKASTIFKRRARQAGGTPVASASTMPKASTDTGSFGTPIKSPSSG